MGLSLFVATGCVPPSIDGGKLNYNNDNSRQSNKPLVFHTNEHNFMHSLKNNSTIRERNNYLDEFLLKSDMQCANYLNEPLNQTTNSTTNQNDSLYMNIADTVSTIFGLSYITNTAKTVFLNGENQETKEKRKAYANALSPEIRKGVDIGRARFAKEMQEKKPLPLDRYSINQLKTDALEYDKQCNLEYGLIEINRALKKMQTQMYTSNNTQQQAKLTIDPKKIKEKVEKATKEVKAKEEQEKVKKAIQKVKVKAEKEKIKKEIKEVKKKEEEAKKQLPIQNLF